MNWEAIGAVGEVIGAVAVIGTLIYLAKQIRHASDQLQSQAVNDAYHRVNEAYDPVYEGSNSEVMWKGLNAPEELTKSEEFLFDLLMDRQMTALMQTARQAEMGILSDDVVKHFAAHYQRVYMDSPGGRAWIQKHYGVAENALATIGLN